MAERCKPSNRDHTRRHTPAWPTALLLFALALIPRLHAAWRGFVTPDEPSWVYRSIRFFEALAEQRWADTFQTGHPGVLTMWIGTLGVLWRRWRAPLDAAADLDWIRAVAWVTPDNAALARRLAPFLPPARIAMAILTALGVAGVYLLVRRLWGRRTALIAGVLLAFDPFAIALSGLLHLDAPATTCMVLCLLAWLAAIEGQHPAPWQAVALSALSGLWGGTGVLAKSPSIWSGAAIGLSTLLCFVWADRPSRARAKRYALLAAAWIAGAAVGLAAFPALWVDPLGVFGQVFGLSDRLFEQPRQLRFFLGQVTADPGLLYYPLVLVLRTTPVTLIGLPLSLLPMFWHAGPVQRRRRQRALLASLWLYVLGYGALMSAGAHKFDRYLLPVLPIVDLLAAVGWMTLLGIVMRLARRRSNQARAEIEFVSLLAVLTLVQGLVVLPSWPYYLDAYNPLVGGMPTALNTLTVGWGEGLEKTAAWIERQPGADAHITATRSPILLASLIDSPVRMLDESSRTLADWIVVTAAERQIEPNRTARLLSNAQLVHVVRIAGREALWVYANRQHAERDHLTRYGAPGDLILCDAPSPFARQAADWNIEIVGQADEAEIVSLLNQWRALHTRLWYLAYPAASPITSRTLRDQLERHAVSLDRVDLDYATATLYILPEEPLFAAGQESFAPADFQGGLRIVDGVVIDPRPRQDQGIAFRLRWESKEKPDSDYRPFIHLLDAADHLYVAGRGEELLVDDRYWSTAHWPAGTRTEAAYRFGLPAGLPPGRYWIAVGLSEAGRTGWVPVLDAADQIRGTTAKVLAVDVAAPQTLTDPAQLQLTNPADVEWREQIRLLGYEHPTRASVGETIVVELIWQSLDEIETDYALRLALRDQTGETAYEQTFPISGYPTSRWRVGELIDARYDLRLPPEIEGARYRLAAQVLDAEQAPLGIAAELGSLEISTQERLFELPRSPQYPLDLMVGDEIRLLGYDLPATEGAPGDEVPLTLYWACKETPETSYTVFVHLLDPAGAVRGQQDAPPQKGDAPTSGWVPGQIVVDRYLIPVAAEAPAGSYRIEAGMYNPQGVVRLPITDEEGDRLPDDRLLLEPEVMIHDAP